MTPFQWLIRLDWMIPLAALVLALGGYLGIARAEELAETNYHLAAHQLRWAVLGGGVMLGLSLPSYRLICRWSPLLFAGSIVLLVAVYFFPPVHGSRRWIPLGPVGMQPSEFAKVAFVLALAHYLMYRASYRRLGGLGWPLLLTLVPVLLILREPDLGTSMVFLPVMFGMLWVAGARRIDLARLLLAGLALLPLLWLQMSREQRSRVTAVWEQTGPGEKPTDDGYQLHQSKQVLALGGFWGSWITGEPGLDRAVYRLPVAHCDFVFPVIGERYGLLGLAALLSVYALLVARIARIAVLTREPFGRLVAAGVAALFAVELVINTAMTVGLAPVTGLSLPLVSYGGSCLSAHAVALGLVLSIGLRQSARMGAEPFRHALPRAAGRAVAASPR